MGLLQDFKERQPIAAPFFLHALNAKSLAHGYVLKGRCLNEMYAVAMEIAKQLNCENPTSPTEPCNHCPSCNWVNQNTHPTVLTLSRLTYLTDDKGNDLDEDGLIKLSKSKTEATMIKTLQIERLLRLLSISSPYYRVIIFTDAEEVIAQETDPQSWFPAPYEWRLVPSREKKRLALKPLERRHFNAASANRFLKTLEEPPKNTLFFFLTDAEESLLDTIVSRCQVVPFQSDATQWLPPLKEEHRQFFRQFAAGLSGNRDLYALAQAFEQRMVLEEGCTLPQAFLAFQTFLRESFQHQELNPENFRRYHRWVKLLDQARTRLDAKTHAEQTLNSLLYQLQQG